MLGRNNLIEELISLAYNWVCQVRNKYITTARMLSLEERWAVSGFYESSILDVTRIKMVPVIENPPFQNVLIQGGINPPDFNKMGGTTFIDCILFSERKISEYNMLLNSNAWFSHLFHELVHVVQYDYLGAENFIKLYVKELANNDFQYDRHLPLEHLAYELQEEYDIAPNRNFSVRNRIIGRKSKF